MEIIKMRDTYKKLPTRINKYKLSKKDMKSIIRGSFSKKELTTKLRDRKYLMVYCTIRRVYIVTRAGAKYFNTMTHLEATNNISNFTWVKELDEAGLKGDRPLNKSELELQEYVAMHRVYPAIGKTVNLDTVSTNKATSMSINEIRIKNRRRGA